MDMCALHTSTETVSETACTTASPLPSDTDKEYDFFMSYSSRDLELIRPIVEQLEQEPYHLKCCLDHREFLPGRSNIQNIEWGLTSCKAVVLFLTPNFIESNYCQHELDLALTLAMENKGRLVPVVLKPCELPPMLGRIHYLEESDPSVIAKKLSAWLESGVTGRFPVEGRLAGSRQITGNEGRLSWTDIGDGYRDITWNDDNKIVLNCLGISMSDDISLLLHNIAIIAGKDISCSYIFAFSFAIFLAVTAAGIQLGFLPVFLIETYRINFQVDIMVFVFLAYPIPILMTTFFLFRKYVSMKVHTKLKKLHAINRITMSKHKAVFYFNDHSKRCSWSFKELIVVKCDFNECKGYLQAKNCGDADFETCWNELMQSPTAVSYCNHLMYKKLPKTFDIRHLVVDNAMCFCQWCEKTEGRIGHNTEETRVVVDEETPGLVSSASNDEEAILLQHEEVPV